MSVHLTMFGIPYRIARYVPVLYWTGMLGAARYLSVPFVSMLDITQYVPYRQLIDMSVQYKIANIAPRYISYRQLVDILVWIGFPYRHTEFISATVSGIEQYAECIARAILRPQAKDRAGKPGKSSARRNRFLPQSIVDGRNRPHTNQLANWCIPPGTAHTTR
ncbi:hypothetical protein B296_00041645 [Ensete ventricosum]|uniref:Uncharacterized protein n=1 Tax=Ensete ventricosum TaxID=4639 RepID=A0A426ZDP6_ENSVE|nr:hypothetical protein B296_00041645 [Ensete ventricosum]